MAIRFFDMFAGIGGFRSGLEAIGGFECVGYYSRKKKYIILKEVITISTYIHFTKEQREQARLCQPLGVVQQHNPNILSSLS